MVKIPDRNSPIRFWEKYFRNCAKLVCTLKSAENCHLSRTIFKRVRLKLYKTRKIFEFGTKFAQKSEIYLICLGFACENSKKWKQKILLAKIIKIKIKVWQKIIYGKFIKLNKTFTRMQTGFSRSYQGDFQKFKYI